MRPHPAPDNGDPPLAVPMTTTEWKQFVTEGTRTAKLATARRDGRPHVAPVWFDLDGDEIVFMTGEDTIKGRSIRRDERVCLCVDDETPPFSFVMIDGDATIVPDADELLRWSTRIAIRYMGAERGAEFGQRNAVPSELLVRVRPTHVSAYRGLAD